MAREVLVNSDFQQSAEELVGPQTDLQAQEAPKEDCFGLVLLAQEPPSLMEGEQEPQLAEVAEVEADNRRSSEQFVPARAGNFRCLRSCPAEALMLGSSRPFPEVGENSAF